MKTQPNQNQKAIIKAKTDADKNKAAAMAMIETPIEMIKAIMLKHEMAVIEVMRELHESREAAVRAENEACAKVLDEMAKEAEEEMEPSGYIDYCRKKAAEIRARRNK